MKKTSKILLLTAVCCLSLSNAYAQRYYDDRGSRRTTYDRTGTVASYLDIHIGEGIGKGAKGIGGVNAAFLYRMSPVFQFGVGTGMDYVHALTLQGREAKKKDYDYHGELTLPVFLRGRYLLTDAGYTRGASFFAQLDFGYRFGLGAFNSGKEGGLFEKFEKCRVKGMFVEPQFGLEVNETLSFSLGLPFQHYNKLITEGSVKEATPETIKEKSLMFMGARLHVTICF